jgi:glutamine kinase
LSKKRVKKNLFVKVVYTFVVGDLFHYGHLQLLQTAKSLGDYHICGVLTDDAAVTFRQKPIANLEERLAVLSSINCIDRVVVQESKDPTENLKKIHREYKGAQLILVHGNNWDEMPGREYIKLIGGKVIQPEYYKRLSDLRIKEEISGSGSLYYEFFNEHFTLDKIIYYSPGKKKFSISTKADTLKALHPLLKKSIIEKSFIFRVQDWVDNAGRIVNQIRKEFKKKIVIRSSTINEDTFYSSKAGFYHSEIDIAAYDTKKIKIAVNKVIKSYEKEGFLNYQNQVLVQDQTENVKISGVVFTEKISTGAPYYTINYDDKTGSTDSVTSGRINSVIEIFKGCKLANSPAKWRKLISATVEIETIIPNTPLDIEFAINSNDDIIIYQVRPLIVTNGTAKASKVETEGILKEIKLRLASLSKPVPYLSGKDNCFSDMAFWNPAEIIGDRPNFLDYSLYNYIVTDNIWHEALSSIGYKKFKHAPLMVCFAGKPYIDMRTTFNALLPEGLNNPLSEKLILHYMRILRKNPELHDKIEFEVINTCFDFTLDKCLEKLQKNGFKKSEISQYRSALVSLTNRVLTSYDDIIKEDTSTVQRLALERASILKKTARSHTFKVPVRKAVKLLDNCKKAGTLPFSRLARMAFIGKSFILSMVEKRYISKDFYDNFMDSLNTVAKTMNRDYSRFCKKRMSKKEFMAKYGHLRPGTYDISSLRYDMNPDLFGQAGGKADRRHKEGSECKIGNQTINKVDKALAENKINISTSGLLDFIKKCIEAREHLKFEFTKDLSSAIEYIALAGEKVCLSREEMAFLDLDTLRKTLSMDNKKIKSFLKNTIEERKREREKQLNTSLPPIIFSKKDFEVIQYYKSKPNFITRKFVEGQVAKLDDHKAGDSLDLTNKLAIIEKADPGYDWLFTKNILGLITRYGGVASHMAIRCAEFGLPAVIGCGDIVYNELLNANAVYLNCDRGEIRVLY